MDKTNGTVEDNDLISIWKVLNEKKSSHTCREAKQNLNIFKLRFFLVPSRYILRLNAQILHLCNRHSSLTSVPEGNGGDNGDDRGTTTHGGAPVEGERATYCFLFDGNTHL